MRRVPWRIFFGDLTLLNTRKHSPSPEPLPAAVTQPDQALTGDAGPSSQRKRGATDQAGGSSSPKHPRLSSDLLTAQRGSTGAAAVSRARRPAPLGLPAPEIKLEPAETARLSKAGHQAWLAALTLKDITDAAHALRGNSMAGANCASLACDMLAYFATTEKPSKPSSEAPNDLNDFMVMTTQEQRTVAVKQELSAVPGRRRPPGDGLHISQSDVHFGPRLDTHVPPDAFHSISRDGTNEILDESGCDLFSFRQIPMQYQEADATLRELAKQCPRADGAEAVSVAYGMVNLGKAGNVFGHQLVYFARPEQVWFIDCQKIQNGVGNPVATRLADLFEFDDRLSKQNAFQTRVFITPTYPIESVSLLRGQMPVVPAIAATAPPVAPDVSAEAVQPSPLDQLMLNAVDAVANIERGDELALKGDYGAALEAYTRAAELDPGHSGVHTGRAKIFIQFKNTEAALEAAKKAVELDKTSADAHDVMGMALAAAGHSDKASEALYKAIALQPGHLRRYEHLARTLVKAARFTEAFAVATAVANSDKNNYTGQLCLARALDGLKHHSKALEAIGELLKRKPNPGLYCFQGICLDKLGNSQAALDAFGKAIAMSESHYLGRVNQASMLHKVNRSNEALVAIEKAISLDPKNSAGYRVKTRICSDLSKASDHKAQALQQLANEENSRGEEFKSMARQAAEQLRQCSNPPVGQAGANAVPNLPT